MVVTGIGQCSLDYLALVKSYPEVDSKKEVVHWKEQGGGPVATALVALSRLGAKCRFHGVIGNDYAGEKIRESLISEHIDVEGLMTRDNASSQKAFIAIEKRSGKRTIFWKRPSGDELRAEELGSEFLKNTDFLLIDGLMKDSSLYAAEEAKKLKIPVMLDAGRLREGVLDIAKKCDYVVASEEFAKDLGWDGNAEGFQKRAKRLGSKVVTATFGDRGSITFINDTIIRVPAFKIDPVDTTGAGDVFHGGYVFGLLQGWNIVDTLRFASALAAMKCRKIGGRAGIPGLNEVFEFLKERNGGSNLSANTEV